MERVPLDTVVRIRSGAVVSGASVYIYERDTETEADVFDGAGGAIGQPLTSDVEGSFPDHWIEEGAYDIAYPDDDDSITPVERVSATTVARIGSPAIKSFHPLLPVSGQTVPPMIDFVSNGTRTAQMGRFRCAIHEDVQQVALVFSNWYLRNDTETGIGNVVREIDGPNSISVSASVETVGGVLHRLSANGSRRWTIEPGGEVLTDPLDVSIAKTDLYFWVRVYVEVESAGMLWYKGRHVPTTTTGQLSVEYAIDPVLDFDSTAIGLADAYWTLGSDQGLVDRVGAMDMTAVGTPTAPTVGAVTGPLGSDFTATDFDGNSQYLTSGFVIGSPLTVFGFAYRDATTTLDTLFGTSGATGAGVAFRNGSDLITVDPQVGGGAGALDFSAGTAAGAWFFYIVELDTTANTAKLWINNTATGGTLTITDDFSSPGTLRLGVFPGPQHYYDGKLSRHGALIGALSVGDRDSLWAAAKSKLADQTTKTGVLSTLGSDTSGTDNVYSPLAVLGTHRFDVQRPIVAIIGDSIAMGLQDSGTQAGATEAFIARALNAARIPNIKIAKGSERGGTFSDPSKRARRTRVIDGCTHAVCEHGVNDYRTGGGYTAQDVREDELAIWVVLAARGMKTYATTLPPGATSTDSWATTANQTAHIDDAIRIGYNDWLRAGAPLNGSMVPEYPATGTSLLAGEVGHPLSGYFEVADTVESARNSGKWKVDGTANKYTADSIHPSAYAHEQMATAIDTSVFT